MEKKHPPSTAKIKFKTKDGKTHNGFYVKDINKYVRDVNRWKDSDTGTWYDGREVIDWDYIATR